MVRPLGETELRMQQHRLTAHLIILGSTTKLEAAGAELITQAANHVSCVLSLWILEDEKRQTFQQQCVGRLIYSYRVVA